MFCHALLRCIFCLHADPGSPNDMDPPSDTTDSPSDTTDSPSAITDPPSDSTNSPDLPETTLYAIIGGAVGVAIVIALTLIILVALALRHRKPAQLLVSDIDVCTLILKVCHFILIDIIVRNDIVCYEISRPVSSDVKLSAVPPPNKGVIPESYTEMPAPPAIPPARGVYGYTANAAYASKQSGQRLDTQYTICNHHAHSLLLIIIIIHGYAIHACRVATTPTYDVIPGSYEEIPAVNTSPANDGYGYTVNRAYDRAPRN